MKNKRCFIYTFLRAVKGNWRNAVFMDCQECISKNELPCLGHLIAFESEARPVILPVGLLRELGEDSFDKTECLLSIDRKQFETLYAGWLEWQAGDPAECPVKQLLRLQESSRCFET